MKTLDDYFDKLQPIVYPLSGICLIEIFIIVRGFPRFLVFQTIPLDFIHEISNKFDFDNKMPITNNDIILEIVL